VTANKLVVVSREQREPWVLDLTLVVLLVSLVLAVLGSLTPSVPEPTVTPSGDQKKIDVEGFSYNR
jgi:hypothetical protein